MTAMLTGLLLMGGAAARAERGDGGRTGADFLRLGGSARAVAQGEAYVARGGAIEALHYNPAGLARMDSAALMFHHGQYLLDMKSNYAALALPARRFTVAADILFMDHGTFTRRTLTNPTGAGTFSSSAFFGRIGAGLALTERLAVGLSVKGFDERIDNASRGGVAVDIGLHAGRRNDLLEAGVVLRNLGPSVRFDVRKEDLPLEVAAGLALHPWGDRLTLSGEIIKPRDRELDYRAGLEFRLAGPLFLRGGYDSRNDLGRQYSVGAGFRIGQAAIDYAFVPFGVAGDAHRFGLEWNFDSPLRSSEE
jgi:hypothetical protein